MGERGHAANIDGRTSSIHPGTVDVVGSPGGGGPDRFEESPFLGSNRTERRGRGRRCKGSWMTDRSAQGAAPLFPTGDGLPTAEDLAAVGSYLVASQAD